MRCIWWNVINVCWNDVGVLDWTSSRDNRVGVRRKRDEFEKEYKRKVTRQPGHSPFGLDEREVFARMGGRVAQESTGGRPNEGSQRKAEDGARGCSIPKVRGMHGADLRNYGSWSADNLWGRQLTCDVELDAKQVRQSTLARWSLQWRQRCAELLWLLQWTG